MTATLEPAVITVEPFDLDSEVPPTMCCLDPRCRYEGTTRYTMPDFQNWDALAIICYDCGREIVRWER